MKMKQVKQNEMTGECWSIQIWGVDYCRKCEYLGTKECGGKRILKTGKNENGHRIPLGEDV